MKKGVHPVVSVALLLIVSLLSVVSLQTWFSSYQSDLFVNSQKQSNVENFKIGVEGIFENNLYLNLGSGVNITKVIVENIECSDIRGYFEGIHSFDLSNCISNFSTSIPKVIIFSNEVVLSE